MRARQDNQGRPCAGSCCPGRMIVQRPQPPAAIHWKCSSCDDEGVISCWADSPYDLRRRTLTVAGPVDGFTITDEVASALRDLRLLDTESARGVFATRADGERPILRATGDELIGLVARRGQP